MDLINGNWIEDLRFTNVYDAEENLIGNTLYFWNLDINDWVGDLRYTYEYGSNGKLTTFEKYFWNSDVNDWESDFRIIEALDVNQNQTGILYHHQDLKDSLKQQIWHLIR